MSTRENRLNAIRGGKMGSDEYRVLNKPRCKVWRAGATTLGAAGSGTTVSFDNVEYDTDSMASPLGVFITCKTPGVYVFQSHCVYQDGFAGPFWTRVLHNNNSALTLAQDNRVDAAFRGTPTGTGVTLAGLWPAGQGDTISLFLSATATASVGLYTGQYILFLAVCLLSTLG